MPTNVTRQGNNLPNGDFNPTVWSKKLNFKYYAQTFLMNICNSTWEGEIKTQGSSVFIRQVPEVEVRQHIVGQKLSYQDVIDEKIELLINKAMEWNIKREDVDAVQSDIDLFNEVTKNASYNMKIAIEKDVLSSIYGDAGSAIATLALDKTKVIDWIVDAGVLMEENNLPDDAGRWIVLPPKIGGLIQKSDLKDASLSGDAKSIVRGGMTNGRLGNVAGIEVYISNNLAKVGTEYQCLAGHKSAVTFAAQINKVEKVRLQDYFGDAIRGLNLYGFKTVLPSGLIHMPATV